MLVSFFCTENGKTTIEYKTWASMIERCYTSRAASYANVTVCDKWHNFQNFAGWYKSQPLHGRGFCLDKDILVPGNKIYSPDTCCLVPKRINSLFVKTAVTTKDLPVGVWHSNYVSKPFTAACGKFLGNYPTIEQARSAYVVYKKTIISDLAEEYKEMLSEELYSLLKDYPLENLTSDQ